MGPPKNHKCAALLMDYIPFTDDRLGALKLAHFSVKEYLVSEQILSGAAANFRTTAQLSHSIIAQTCLAYLLHFNRPDSITRVNLASFPLAQYAAELWVFHFHSASSNQGSAAVIQKLLLRLFEPFPSCVMVNWLRLHLSDKPWAAIDFDHPIDEVASPLYHACYNGLNNVV